MTAATLHPEPTGAQPGDLSGSLPGEVAARLEQLGREDRERALRLLQVAERCCGGDVSVLVAVVEAVTS